MAAPDDDTQTQEAPPPQQQPQGGLLGIDDPQVQRLIQQFMPQPVQVDQTPVHRGWLSRLGEAIGGGKPPGLPMSGADEESAGLRALGDFGTGLMAASHYQPGQTLFSNLAGGFQGAERSLRGSEQMSASTLGAQQAYQQQLAQDRMGALKVALPMLMQQRMMNQPNPLAANTTGRPNLAAPWTGSEAPVNAAGDSATRKASEGGPPAPGTPAAAVAQQTHDFWAKQGYTEPQIAGILAGGPGSESDFSPTASGDKGTSYGLYQQHGERLAAMQKYFGLTGGQMPTADQQNQYSAFEISPQGPLAKVGEQLRNTKTASDDAAVWTRGFGVPKDPTEIGRRAAGASRFDGLYAAPVAPPGGSKTAAAPPAAQPAATPPQGAQALPLPPTPPPGMLSGPAAPEAAPDKVAARLGGTSFAGPGAAMPDPLAGAKAEARTTNTPVAVGNGGFIMPTGMYVSKAPAAGLPGTAPPPTTTPNAPVQPPVTTTPLAPPAPQPGSQQPTDTRPDVELTPHEYIQRHFTPATDADRQTFTVPADPAAMQRAQAVMADAAKAKAAAAQNLGLALTDADRTKATESYTKANNDFQTANASISDLQQKAQMASTAAAAKFEEDQRARLATTYNQLQAQKATNLNQTQAEQAAAALKAQELQQQMEIERIKSGQTVHQQIQAQSAQNAQTNTIAPMSAQAMKAHQMNLGLAQLQPILQDLPPGGGALGAVLNDHPDLAPLFSAAGIINTPQADAVRLVNGLVSNISTEMKPTGLGALREYEGDAFTAQLPSLMSTPGGQQKAIAMLQNMNDRIQTEASWMNSYYNRKVPDEFSDKPGAMRPAHDLDSDNPKETAQQRMDRELGPIVPSYTGPPSGSGQAQWEQSVPPGKPYYKTWAVPDPKNPGQPLRDQNGNVRTTKTLEVKPWQ